MFALYRVKRLNNVDLLDVGPTSPYSTVAADEFSFVTGTRAVGYRPKIIKMSE